MNVKKTNVEILPGSEVAPGHCVIINEYDRPSAKLVAIITEIRSGMIHCRYLNRDVDKNYKNVVTFDPTPTDTFGVEIHSNGSCYWVERIADSQAVYKDGKPRPWQGDSASEPFPIIQSLRAKD